MPSLVDLILKHDGGVEDDTAWKLNFSHHFLVQEQLSSRESYYI